MRLGDTCHPVSVSTCPLRRVSRRKTVKSRADKCIAAILYVYVCTYLLALRIIASCLFFLVNPVILGKICKLSMVIGILMRQVY